MRASAVFPQLEIGTDPEVIAKYARTVEELGYERLVIFDHVLGADPNRPGGWTVRQVIHHVADSHLNSYVRFRLALTEETPAIKGYDEAQWAELEDARRAPVQVSLGLLDSLHNRWVRLLRSLQPEDFAREFKHPERGTMSLDANLALYSWHGHHHTAHIANLRQRMGWN